MENYKEELENDIKNLKELKNKVMKLYMEFAQSKREGLIDMNVTKSIDIEIYILEAELKGYLKGKNESLAVNIGKSSQEKK